jgi:hypothetical protein
LRLKGAGRRRNVSVVAQSKEGRKEKENPEAQRGRRFAEAARGRRTYKPEGTR